MQNDCLICGKHLDDTFEIYRNEYLVINHFVLKPDGEDNYLGYYMIESRRHFKGFYDASEEEAAALGNAQRALAKAMKKALECEHVYFFVLGDGIPHLHIHAVAKYTGAPREFWGPRVDDWPEAPRGGEKEILKVNEAVAAELNKIV